MNLTAIQFDPFISWPLLACLALIALVLIGVLAWRGLAGWLWRGAAAALVLTALANPSVQQEQRAPLSDIVAVLVDESASQQIAGRSEATTRALESLRTTIGAREGTDLRIIPVKDAPNNAGTLAMGALNAALADIPQNRLAGVLILSDGQVHDAEQMPDLPAPVHLLTTGQPQDWDRRLVIDTAPAFAILGEAAPLRLHIEDQGAVPADVAAPEVVISIDGTEQARLQVAPGAPLNLKLNLTHAGVNMVHVSVAPQSGELTDRNNAAIIEVNGVRDRLQVLLVSGEPHPGGRTWRNLLKSDSAVDLVHFTILRPPEKHDGVPVGEMSLIAFPTRELFLDKIDEFDLIIFDRYLLRGILPGQYLGNVRSYVERGGAVLVAAGPGFASANSLAYSGLGEILPARPSGQVIEAPYPPLLSETGNRHPVTEGLDGKWGRWLRQIEVTTQPGAQVLMTGIDEHPLLVLDRVGEGRVALLASDQAWLWARGYEGGGPQLDLFRRLAHWMMKEPELEEEALTARTDGNQMQITRRSLSDNGPRFVELTTPGGATKRLPLKEVSPGRFTASYESEEIGLYRLDDGELTAVAALGPRAPKEFEETIANPDKLAPLLKATKGGAFALSDGMPTIRWVNEGRVAAGRGWLGLTPRDASLTQSVRLTPALPAWLGLLLAALLAMAAWLREGRR